MEMKMYTIYDTVAEEAGPPFMAPNDGVAKRSYDQAMSQTPAHLKVEYQLFAIAEYNTNDMGVTGITPRFIETTLVEAQLHEVMK